MLFHPRRAPSEPNAGIRPLGPARITPAYHEFAQVWYVLEEPPIVGRHFAPDMIFPGSALR